MTQCSCQVRRKFTQADFEVQWQPQLEQTARHRIGILGGTFNPPHLGHLLMAEQAGSQLELDEVWFMPTFIPPHIEGKETISAHHRVQMTQLAIEGNPRFKLQTYEITKGDKSYTIETMQAFRDLYPQTDFYFIIGTDSANHLHTWLEIDQLMTLVQFVGIHRPGEKAYQGSYPILWLDSPMVDISSTDLRLRVYLDQSIKYQVPEAVLNYIEENQLYAFTRNEELDE
ncbi:nicotinate-nucleotide adenylyltransferase [Vaginisenegalia massiliensis]|uniref:nicotinate-nucleotide adenylyltransferase n=1 Tax=Vaginisenegalia massiliensis TaxID=2058294 RepID=UPI000F54AC26|nr:nicotinate-nucleotide adenylyltransferase [Vaginisenegalia massiliensis]